jgi:ABC-type uncharacterized transport system substrate-binding protein
MTIADGDKVSGTSGYDPVAVGLVASLARPGGNLTGVTTLSTEVAPKRLELLHELLPKATAIGLLVNPAVAYAEVISRELQAPARALGLHLHVLGASTVHDFDAVFATLTRLRAEGLVMAAIRSSAATANSSPHWPSATPWQRFTSIATSLRPVA